MIVDTHLKGEIIMTSFKQSHGAYRILLIRTAVARVPRRRNIMRRICTNLLPIALFLLVVPSVLASTTWYVDGVNGEDNNNCETTQSACKTIGHAISLAASGDSIIVASATYTENLTVTFSLNVIGAGASTTIMDGRGINRVLSISGGNVTLSGLTIRHGAVAFSNGGVGAGIFNSGNLLVIASTITENSISVTCPVRSSCSAGGAGIYNSNAAKLTISNSTVAGNIVRAQCSTNFCLASADGGGIYNRGTMVMSNSTLAANSAQYTFGFGFARGGGISNRGPATISNSTLSENSAINGGGIFNYQGYGVTLQNSIVAKSSSGGNCAGTMTSNGYNISTDSTCTFNNVRDLNSTDPQLGPLQYNGGPTQTMALPSGSPAVDAGNPNGCTDGQGHLLTTDQRGMPRPDPEDKGGCDMGAYESQSD